MMTIVRKMEHKMGYETNYSVKWKTLGARFRYLFLMGFICGSAFFVATMSRIQDLFDRSWNLDSNSWRYQLTHNQNRSGRFTIETSGCTIPYLNPLDETIKQFVKYPTKIKPCKNSTATLLEYHKSKISVRKEALRYYNITDGSKVHCCYEAFYRPRAVDDIFSRYIDERVKYKPCIIFYDAIEVKDEFVRVTCYLNVFKIIYKQFYLTAPKKKFVSHNDKPEIGRNKSAYNILVLGIDAVSRLNLYRTMPKTVNFILNNGGIDLTGYNKVGDNTFPNLIPLLLGIKHTELKHTCVPYEKANFDNCPFVWEWFKQAGYYTALAEDTSHLGTFNYAKYGFGKAPTDYYIHTFINEAERAVGNNKDLNGYLCMNDKHFYQVLLDYAQELTTTLNDHKLFGFFWEVTMSHDYLNYPMLIDGSYLRFLKSLQSSNYLNKTIIILMSDHGIRWGGIRRTKQGRLEERLPFSIILVPPSFREKYSVAYNNMKINSKRLTTPFDVHETLMDLVNLDNIENNATLAKSNTNYAEKRGISLFLPIPSNRTCAMAGIDDHWCTCHKGTPLAKESLEATVAANDLVKHLNNLLRDHQKCAFIKLSEILEATAVESGTPESKEKGWREVMIVVRTVPGDAILEATLRRDKNATTWIPVGSVSRLNLYGSQSDCVQNSLLKLYCYCL